MKKTEIDSFVTDNYEMLLCVARGMAFKKFRKYDPTTLITAAYEHVLNNAAKIQDENQLQRWFIAKMSFESGYSNSATSRENLLQSMEFITDVTDNTDDLEYKLNKDLREMDSRGLIVAYHYKQKDPVKRIFFEAYFIKGYSTVRSIAKYFNLSTPIAHQYIKEMQLDIRRFAQDNNITFGNLN